jgi:elongation factor G
MGAGDRKPSGARCIGIVGPFQSGKTALLESLLERAGRIERAGRAGATVGDAQPEARRHGMSVEPNVATLTYIDETITFIDCPGSIEFLHDMRTVLPVCDAAVVVCEPDERKVPALEIILRELEEAEIPRFLFLNKVDGAERSVRETLVLLQRASRTPLLLRQLPIWQDGIAVGFIDLALERAFVYREHAPSEVIALPDGELPAEREARFAMLERLADYDDALMEQLISDIEPPRDRIFEDLARELRERHVVPVLMGSADRGHGVTRLLKALRHEAPGIAETRARLGVPDAGPPLAQVMKTQHAGQGGKISIARVLRGGFREGDAVVGSGGAETRIGGIVGFHGAQTTRLAEAAEGEVVGFGRLEHVATGDCIAAGKQRPNAIASVAPPEAVYHAALRSKERRDDVRLTGALTKIAEEDPAFVFETRAETGELCLLGQGEMHLRVALERLESRFNVQVEAGRARIGYRETLQASGSARGRHRKQSGGHGQFGDVVLEVAPLPRGAGFEFRDRISGGVVPRQYIPSVEAGVRAGLHKGPLGFPVVDVAVTLTDGSYHTVDSSDAAFQAAARLALAEILPKAKPVLLEPVLAVEIAIPSEAMAKASGLVSARRGQILGYDSRPGWPGWDVIQAQIPEAEMAGLIIELRSATAGVGSFRSTFDHMAELTGRPAELVLAESRGA